MVITTRGELLGCGNNLYGQLGLGHTARQATLVLVGVLGKSAAAQVAAAKVACGNRHNFVLTSQGVLLACGNNNDGQLGLGHTINRNRLTSVALPGHASHVWPAWPRTTGHASDNHAGASASARRCALACGRDFTAVLTVDGTALGCGANRLGQLGNENKLAQSRLAPAVLPDTAVVSSVVCGNEFMLWTILC